MKKALLFAILLGQTYAIHAQVPIYKDPKQPIDARVNDLLSKMTLDEKVAQTVTIWQQRADFLYDANGKFDIEKAKKNLAFGLGEVARPSENPKGWLGGFGRNATEMAEVTNIIQKFFIENTRLGIPVLFHEEGLHGLPAKDATSFPQAIALASTWDDDLSKQIFTVVAAEIRSRGVQHVLAPVIDIARDPRWGRFEETYGEDSYLVSRMGVAAVKGFQGENTLNGIDNQHVMATLKHLTGHGQPEAGNNTAPANLGEREVREAFLPPFKAAIKEANAQAVMASYNEIDGVPSHANSFLLKKVLKEEWGFKGLIVSDYGGVVELQSRHHLVETPAEAAVLAFKTGIDIETPDITTYQFLKPAIESGKLSVAILNQAVARILRAKFMLGLFDNPYVDVAKAEAISKLESSGKLAKEAAEKAIVLLQNKDNILPLNLTKFNGSAIKNIAVIGPNAARQQLGGYSDSPKYVVTLLEGIKNKVGAKAKVSYAEGCRLIEESEYNRWYKDATTATKEEDNKPRIEEAVKIAATADVIILALGSDEALNREGWVESHLGDRSSIELFGQQNELLNRLSKLGKPIIVTLSNGAPLAIQNVQEKAKGILECWYLGQEGGNAIANVLFGSVNPSGKLPATFPRTTGQIPAYYNYKPMARRGYHFEDSTPLYNFGFGLSYTNYTYSKPTLDKTVIKNGEKTSVSVTVTNSGKTDGDEIVQMYIRDMVSSVTRPVKELKGFKRVSLKAGESKTVTIDITPEKLMIWDLQMKNVIEPGDFEIMVGSSSNDKDLQKLILKVEN
jgi:beta-glucosidase